MKPPQTITIGTESWPVRALLDHIGNLRDQAGNYEAALRSAGVPVYVLPPDPCFDVRTALSPSEVPDPCGPPPAGLVYVYPDTPDRGLLHTGEYVALSPALQRAVAAVELLVELSGVPAFVDAVETNELKNILTNTLSRGKVAP